jgi:4-amino-4-deoxy-L-arabinose transferase-like glycosyltransferase
MGSNQLNSSIKILLLTITITLLLKLFIYPIFYPNLYMDNAEAIYLGTLFEWGNYKHPPLLNFIMQGFDLIFNRSIFAFYLLPQLYLLLVYYAVFQLAKKFTTTQNAILAVICLNFFDAFNTRSNILTQDTITMLPFVLCVYFYHNFLERNDYKNAILLGVTVGLGSLAKYFLLFPQSQLHYMQFFMQKF